MSLAMHRIPCRYHEDAPALGVCMRCRSPVCQGCRTRLRGINLCHRCLNRLAQPVEAAAAAGGGIDVGGLFLFGSVSIFVALCFGWIGGLAAPDPNAYKEKAAVTRPVR